MAAFNKFATIPFNYFDNKDNSNLDKAAELRMAADMDIIRFAKAQSDKRLMEKGIDPKSL
jgi:hypothetical protein